MRQEIAFCFFRFSNTPGTLVYNTRPRSDTDGGCEYEVTATSEPHAQAEKDKETDKAASKRTNGRGEFDRQVEREAKPTVMGGQHTHENVHSGRS